MSNTPIFLQEIISIKVWSVLCNGSNLGMISTSTDSSPHKCLSLRAHLSYGCAISGYNLTLTLRRCLHIFFCLSLFFHQYFLGEGKSSMSTFSRFHFIGFLVCLAFSYFHFSLQMLFITASLSKCLQSLLSRLCQTLSLLSIISIQQIVTASKLENLNLYNFSPNVVSVGVPVLNWKWIVSEKTK